MTLALPLPAADATLRSSSAVQIFDALHTQILSLQLPPGSNVSEVEADEGQG